MFFIWSALAAASSIVKHLYPSLGTQQALRILAEAVPGDPALPRVGH